MPSTTARVRSLLAALDYPSGDVRLRCGGLALELAELIDAGRGDEDPFGNGHTPRWLLDYVLSDVTDCPNEPPCWLNEIRYRCARGWWDDGIPWNAKQTNHTNGGTNEEHHIADD